MAEPRIERSLKLRMLGDWGQANFHRILNFLSWEVCLRSGLSTRVEILSLRGGRLIDAVLDVGNGEADLSVATPPMLLTQALTGQGMFAAHAPVPELRALAVIPQNDRLLLAIDSKFGIRSFEDLRRKRPPLRIATGLDDGLDFIGYVAMRYMEAHGIDKATLESWGGSYINKVWPNAWPDACLKAVRDGRADAVLHEAIMTPWWKNAMANTERPLTLIPAERAALDKLSAEEGFRSNPLPAGWFKGIEKQTDALDFSDFLILVRSDMPEDVAHLLTWVLVERREAMVQVQFAHIPANECGVTYPLEPAKMPLTSVPLHRGAERYYREAGLLVAGQLLDE